MSESGRAHFVPPLFVSACKEADERGSRLLVLGGKR